MSRNKSFLKERRDHIRALKKRRDWLAARVILSDKRLDWDKAEKTALDWAIQELIVLYPELDRVDHTD